jgi:hypothetical protein
MTASAISPFDPSPAANTGHPLLPQNIVLEGPRRVAKEPLMLGKMTSTSVFYCGSEHGNYTSNGR